MEQKTKKRLLGAGKLLLWAAVGFVALRWALPLATPFLIAFGVATLMEPAVRALGRRGMPRAAASGILTLVILGLFALLIWSLGVRLYRELREIAGELPGTVARIEEIFEGLRAGGWGGGTGELMESLSDSLLGSGSELLSTLSAKFLSFLSSFAGRLPDFFLAALTCLLAVFFSSAEYPAVTGFLKRQIPESWRRKFRESRERLKGTLGKWLAAQAKLMAITFAELAAGFLLLGFEQVLLPAAALALIDALPVFGTGVVLLPWAALSLIRGDTRLAIGLALLYGVIALVRNLMEPRLVGKQLGVPPLAMLCAMYIGWKLVPPFGMILLPLVLVLVKQLSDWGYVKLWK